MVTIPRAVLHEVPSFPMSSDTDLTPFSGNTGTKISCTSSAFKIALGTCRPAVRSTLLNDVREEMTSTIEAYNGSVSSDGGA